MKKRNLFMSAALMCGFCSLAFSFKNTELHWFWASNKPAGIIMGIAAAFFATLWINAGIKMKSKKINS